MKTFFFSFLFCFVSFFLFHFSEFNMTLVKNHIQKQPFLKFLPIFTMSQCFFDLEVRDKKKKQMVIWKFSEKESPFLCLFLLNWKKQISYDFLICVICTNSYCSVVDYSFIIYFFRTSGLSKMALQHFWYFPFSNFKTSLSKILWKKKYKFLRHIFLNSKTKFQRLTSLGKKMVDLWKCLLKSLFSWLIVSKLKNYHKLNFSISDSTDYPPGMRRRSDVSFRSHIGWYVADHVKTSSRCRNWYVNETDLFETSLRRLTVT